jgi:hypothetical protein
MKNHNVIVHILYIFFFDKSTHIILITYINDFKIIIFLFFSFFFIAEFRSFSASTNFTVKDGFCIRWRLKLKSSYFNVLVWSLVPLKYIFRVYVFSGFRFFYSSNLWVFSMSLSLFLLQNLKYVLFLFSTFHLI